MGRTEVTKTWKLRGNVIFPSSGARGGGQEVPIFSVFLASMEAHSELTVSRLWAFCLHTGYNCREHEYTHTPPHTSGLSPGGLNLNSRPHTPRRPRFYLRTSLPLRTQAARGHRPFRTTRCSNWMKNYRKPGRLQLNWVKVQVGANKNIKQAGSRISNCSVLLESPDGRC